MILNLEKINKELRNKTPDNIIKWALNLSQKRIVTTSFGKYSAILLSKILKYDKEIKVVWCDTLFNEDSTYKHSEKLINDFNLNLYTYRPTKSRREIEDTLGLPTINDQNHSEFSEIVKLEPFRRAIEELQPDLWFTNIRVRQTEFRDNKDILSYSKDGILKISPFYYWTDEDLEQYLSDHNLPKNHSYFDPIKALETRECGIHLQ
jgi:phosphoadenosine phosphosulfate reductase